MDINVIQQFETNQSVDELQWHTTGAQFTQDQVSLRQQIRRDTHSVFGASVSGAASCFHELLR